jgi:iron complex transport system substrate-binding protein
MRQSGQQASGSGLGRREFLRAFALLSLSAVRPLDTIAASATTPAAAPRPPSDQSPLRLVALGPGALRLLVYLNATDGLCAIEAMEQRGPSGRPYTFMLGDLSDRLPVIGPGGVGRLPDLERLLTVEPDLAVAVTLDEQQVRMLEQRADIPVLLLSYGDIGELQLPVFSESLRRLAEPLGRQARAEALLATIDASLAELAMRVADVEPVLAYIGGISLKGQQGLASTQAGHLPLRWAGADNLADRISESGHRFIDLEQLLAWNPPVLFIDGGGLPAVLQEVAISPGLFTALDAVQRGQVFATLPFNSYNTNVEHALINAWFIASRLYPEQFPAFDSVAKANAIYRDFYGEPLYARLRADGQGSQPGFARVDLITGEVYPVPIDGG